VNVVITGGAGFLGARLAGSLLAGSLLAGSLLADRALSLAGGPERPLARLSLIDRVAPDAGLAGDRRVQVWQGDLVSALESGRPSPLDDADLVFHLAAAVSAECERDFDLGMRTNLAGTQAVLARCRATGRTPVVVFASSIAVFGGTATHPLPDVITDSTLPAPQSSYGFQKFIGEQLVADYTRKGFIRGRSVRLMTVSVRPGRPNGAASSFLSGIIREPLNGMRCGSPVGPDTAVALSSPDRAIEGLIRAATAAPEGWGDATAVNLPPITVTVGEMVAVLGRVAGPAVSALVDWQPDEAVAAIVRGWPARLHAARAAALGLHPDPDFETIVRAYIRQTRG
jgi:nucleoside-diphosphate-sugar epimerase